jgi:hypothetical protein
MTTGRILSTITMLMLAFALSGCAQVADSLISGAVSGLGRAASEHAEQAVYKKMAPKEKLPPPSTVGWGNFMALQAQIVFGYSFSPGGMNPSQTGYLPGEWTRFSFGSDDNEEDIVLERAFLKQEADGAEWWRAAWHEGEDSWIYEGLFTADQGELVRLRARDVDGNEGEVPVTNSSVFIPPTELTDESIAGATTGIETINTPAGSFQAERVSYIAVTGEGEMVWWLTDKVPGGMVVYQGMDSNDEINWRCVLQDKGTDATTILDSY